jgi:hypothetical protein
MKFKIENSQISLFFPKKLGIRKELFKLEELLSDRFMTPFQMIQVPDEAPDDIPRIQAKTKNGHSELIISQNNITIHSFYDNGWNEDWSKCKDYISKNRTAIINISKSLSIDKAYYFGLKLNFFFEFEKKELIIEHFKKFFIKNTSLKDLYEINFKFVFVEKEKYYKNISLDVKTKYKATENVERIVPAYLESMENGILLQIDINDKYCYNFQKNYYTSDSESEEIISIMDNILKYKIDNIFEGDI